MIEFTAVGMFAIEAGSGTFGIVADAGVGHEATREAESIGHIARPTYFRIGQIPWIAECLVGHGIPSWGHLQRSRIP
jgi:hypothetical protein